MAFEVENSKATHITQAVNMYRKLPEEVNNCRRTSGQREAQHKWCDYNGEKLSDEYHDFHIK